MSRNRRNGADDYYQSHLSGTRSLYAQNTSNQRQYAIQMMYTRVLTELAVNRFKWLNLPDSIDPRFLELTLFRKALSVFYYDEQYGRHFALAGSPNGNINMIENPTAFLVTGNNFVGKTISAKKAVPIWANALRVPDIDIVSLWAFKLAELDRTVEINSKAFRRTKVIVTTENTKLSATNINRMIDEGQPHIQVTAPLGEMVTALDMGGSPQSLETLSILRNAEWSRCMGLLGIDNGNQDKKERLVAAEVDANSDQTESAKSVNINARKYACKQINARYGLNIDVEYNTDIVKQMNSAVANTGDDSASEDYE